MVSLNSQDGSPGLKKSSLFSSALLFVFTCIAGFVKEMAADREGELEASQQVFYAVVGFAAFAAAGSPGLR
jgi:hypothetical protein